MAMKERPRFQHSPERISPLNLSRSTFGNAKSQRNVEREWYSKPNS
jgi:hypothetical protein